MMACNLRAICVATTNPISCSHQWQFLIIPKHKICNKPYRLKSAFSGVQSEESGSDDEFTPNVGSSSSSARSQLDLLDQLTSTTISSSSSSRTQGYESDGASWKPTIRDQLADLVGDRDDDFSIPLGKNLKKVSPKFLTTSQKRNIKRQTYLNEVSERNDSVFFATIGAFVLLPPLFILGIAIVTGYVQLLP